MLMNSLGNLLVNSHKILIIFEISSSVFLHLGRVVHVIHGFSACRFLKKKICKSQFDKVRPSAQQAKDQSERSRQGLKCFDLTQLLLPYATSPFLFLFLHYKWSLVSILIVHVP